MPDNYHTLAKTGNGLYRISGSRHISFAYHVKSETEIKALIDALWKQHHDATHICYAWRLGWEKRNYRTNDDGEPSGTAGKPIYGQILSFDITNVLVAVVRYYGGTKLGTGGLIDAYRTAAKSAIEDAGVIENEVMDHFTIQFAHSGMPSVMKALKEMQMEKIETIVAETCSIEFLVRKSFRALVEDLADHSEGSTLIHHATL